MLESIEHIDHSLFFMVNSNHNAFWDALMWNISGKLQWIPLYLFILWRLIKKFRTKFWIAVLLVVIGIGLTDQGSVRLFKNQFQRYRPCHNLEIMHQVHKVNNKCGGKYGFISSHAANTSFMALFFLLLLMKRKHKDPYLLLLLWPIIVGYSRVYLGVHYPSDVIFGSIYGIMIAFLLWRVVVHFKLLTLD